MSYAVSLAITATAELLVVCSHQHNAETGHRHHDGLEQDERNSKDTAAKDDEDEDDDDSVQRARAWDDWKDGNTHDTCSRIFYKKLASIQRKFVVPENNFQTQPTNETAQFWSRALLRVYGTSLIA